MTADIFESQVVRMSQALAEHDIDGLMRHYDAGLVFVDTQTGQRLGKAGLRDYVLDLWAQQPDFAVRLVASHTHGDDFVATFVASATMRSRRGDPVQVEWLMPTIYTFDPATRTVVREVTFVDDEMLQRRLTDLDVL